MYQSTYFIEKASNTFADNLAAFGLAFTLNAIAAGRSQIHLEDKGYAFAVTCEPAIRQEWVEVCAFFSGAPMLITVDSKATKKEGKIVKVLKGPKLDSLPEADGRVFLDYEIEKQNTSAYWDWIKSLKTPEQRKQWHNGEIKPSSLPNPGWEIFRAVNPGGLQSYNVPLAIWWEAQKAFPELLKILLALTAQYPNRVEDAEQAWAALCKTQGWEKTGAVTANQLLNPSQGKGTNHIKAEWRDPNNLKGFWLLEWLKTVGLFQGGYTRLIKKTKDRKTYVLCPTRLGWNQHSAVMKRFRESMGSETAIKMDILASLRYTEAFLEHSAEARAESLSEDIFGEAPTDLVSGMQMAFYKNLGNSPAVMNIASINLPRWVAPRKPEDLAEFQDSLAEHISVVRNLDESRGDQFHLLARYRDFLSANDLDAFFDFTNAYSGFVMSQLEKNNSFVRPFSIPTLEVLMRNNNEVDYSQIIQSQGFQDIAYAIRHATITAQYRKVNKSKYQVRYDVRYGLGQQLARKSNYPSDFLAELANFLSEYNRETSQEYENLMNRYKGNIPENIRRQMRRSVSEGAITELIELLGKFNNDSKLICNMLVAFGYARDMRSKDAPKEEDIQVDDSLSGDDDSIESED